jgi:hypothetical protein
VEHQHQDGPLQHECREILPEGFKIIGSVCPHYLFKYFVNDARICAESIGIDRIRAAMLPRVAGTRASDKECRWKTYLLGDVTYMIGGLSADTRQVNSGFDTIADVNVTITSWSDGDSSQDLYVTENNITAAK